ncbi:multiple sugar transport system permease protein [Nonomuraea thailandensis]|uniref:Multiple sugar transport system permease protein n=1 Tax=Nonomuraea thailandensis TaxID=1188745 RepID=A0A9X2GXK6_9ACTN|nr:carbohydrate ABC transporter permease [Nonomuraea thailandensis]MCP2365567.1 multiple sugar transport system permease protein [Nonomuraea thailandensis]
MNPNVRRLPMTALGVLFLAVMLFPVYWMVNSSLQSSSGATTRDWFPLDATLSGYARAITEQGQNFVTSLLIALGTVVLTLIIATPAAYGLSRIRSRGANTFVLVLLITQMIPAMVIANALYPLFNSLFLINNVFGLILANTAAGIPFAVLLIRAFMGSIPRALVEAAMVDGAGQLRAFVSVVVPISKNAIVTAALFTFLSAWSDFLFALTLTSTPEVRPITLGIYDYISANTQDWDTVMATAVLASVPAALLLIFAQRYIAAGAVAGAVK